MAKSTPVKKRRPVRSTCKAYRDGHSPSPSRLTCKRKRHVFRLALRSALTTPYCGGPPWSSAGAGEASRVQHDPALHSRDVRQISASVPVIASPLAADCSIWPQLRSTSLWPSSASPFIRWPWAAKDWAGSAQPKAGWRIRTTAEGPNYCAGSPVVHDVHLPISHLQPQLISGHQALKCITSVRSHMRPKASSIPKYLDSGVNDLFAVAKQKRARHTFTRT